MTTDLNLAWTPTKEVNTRFGPRLVRNAPVTEAFWTAWRARKDSLKAEGYSVSKDDRGQWRVTHWGKIDTEQRAAAIEASRATDADVTIPCPTGYAYLPYQRAGIAYALARPATLIGDEMGLGKTIQAIGIINSTPAARRVLIVCPASLKLNWARELRRWLTVDLQVTIANGTFPADGIAIINYDILAKHIEAIRSVAWDIAIFDEAHYVKNSKAKRTKLVCGDREAGTPAIRAARRVMLTGTPIANRPSELFSLLHYLDPAQWSSFFGYAKRYCGAFHNGFGWDFSGASNLAELQTKLRASLMVRRLKKDVLTELPAKRRQVIELPCNGAAKAVRAELEAYESRADRLASLQAAVELAKASEDPADYRKAVAALREGQEAVFSEISRLRHETAVAKIQAIVDFIRNALDDGDSKVVLFLHHKDVVAAVADEFGAEAVTLDGDTPIQARQDAVDRFQADASCKLFIGTIGAAGVGITLTASSHVVFGELDWVPGNLSQAEDRCHRIGQTDSVLVQHIVLEGSLDATMAQRVVDKQEVLDAVLDSADKPVYEAEPVFVAKTAPATVDTTPKQIDLLAAKLTVEQRSVAHQAMQIIAGLCDGAVKLDDIGFNKADSYIGHAFAAQSSLSPKQAAIACKLARKYRRQLPTTITAIITAAFE